MCVARNLILVMLMILTCGISAQYEDLRPTDAELSVLENALENDTSLAELLSWFGEPDSLYYAYKINRWRSDSCWKAHQAHLDRMDIGETETFEFIPLVDWFTRNDSFARESGISYLIRTDEATILFDLGLNAENKHPSPLLANMEAMGIDIAEIDAIVISHNHDDHTGGARWASECTYSLSDGETSLPDIPVYTPVEMMQKGPADTCMPNPVIIANGVATIGIIHNPIFVGDVAEQAVAVNVKGKGIVIISGCGHQSVEKMIARSEKLFDTAPYAMLGGFHFPIEEGRNITWMYKYCVADKLPWDYLTPQDVEAKIRLMQEKGVKVAGVSGHDSCDKAIALFKEAFGENYRDIEVGTRVTF